MKYEDLQLLEEYAELENTEWGEALRGLLECHNRLDCVSEKFAKALEKELKDFLDYAKENCEIVEKKEMQEVKFKELVWNDH